MRIALLGGAYKNAGDFLIEKRCIELLKENIQDCQITLYKRNKDLTEFIEEINQQDCIVIGGGPAYAKEFYPGNVKLVEDLDKIKIPIFSLGLGWWGRASSFAEIHAHSFDEVSQNLLEQMSHVYPLSCRDWESFHVIKNAGLRAKMTGCVAWYNIPFVEKTALIKRDGNVICISDPASTKNYSLAVELVDLLKVKYPGYTLKFVFHRGCGAQDDYTSAEQANLQKQLKDTLLKKGCEIVDISYGCEGFSVYDTCCLHIGFRVHAHIYNLSIRNKSILISEDSRGDGVNNALGLPLVRAYKNSYIKKPNRLYYAYMNRFGKNKNAIKELAQVMDEIDACDELLYSSVFQRMIGYYQEMVDYIKGMEKVVKSVTQ